MIHFLNELTNVVFGTISFSVKSIWMFLTLDMSDVAEATFKSARIAKATTIARDIFIWFDRIVSCVFFYRPSQVVSQGERILSALFFCDFSIITLSRFFIEYQWGKCDCTNNANLALVCRAALERQIQQRSSWMTFEKESAV